MCVFFQPAHQISITRSWCYEDGILCCDGEVTNVVSFDLPSQFIDAILPTDEQLSNNGNPDLFSSDIPLDDGSVQYSLLEGGGTVGDGLFASNEFVPSGDVVYPDQNQDDLVAAGGIIGGDASWFQSWEEIWMDNFSDGKLSWAGEKNCDSLMRVLWLLKTESWKEKEEEEEEREKEKVKRRRKFNLACMYVYILGWSID